MRSGFFKLSLLSLWTALSITPDMSFAGDINELKVKHRSVYNKIDYLIPKGWVVIDGETDWIAPNKNKYFWEPEFNPDEDAYYGVAKVYPFLSMADHETRTLRSVDEVAAATLHALEVAAKAKRLNQPVKMTLDGKPAVSLSTSMLKDKVHYQIFIQMTKRDIAIVSGIGPKHKWPEIKKLVDEISGTIRLAQ